MSAAQTELPDAHELFNFASRFSSDLTFEHLEYAPKAQIERLTALYFKHKKMSDLKNAKITMAQSEKKQSVQEATLAKLFPRDVFSAAARDDLAELTDSYQRIKQKHPSGDFFTGLRTERSDQGRATLKAENRKLELSELARIIKDRKLLLEQLKKPKFTSLVLKSKEYN